MESAPIFYAKFALTKMEMKGIFRVPAELQ